MNIEKDTLKTCQTGRVDSRVGQSQPPCPNKPAKGSMLCAQCRAAGLARVLGTADD